MVPNFVEIALTVAEIWCFFICQDGGCRHIGFLKFRIFNRPTHHLPFSVFARWRPSATLHFSKFRLLTASTVWRANMFYCTTFSADRSNGRGDIAISRFFKMAAVRRLGFRKVRDFNFRCGSEAQYA